MNFSSQIIGWYKEHKRDLPWRNTQDPYRIWLSEIILQQTRVEQGINYYYKFINTFPNLRDLADAPLDKIMKLWQGLGYYSRARNLHITAKYIVDHYNGVFPEVYRQLRELKGVGDYTAAAIASFAFNKACAVVDGNVIRVIARIFGITEPIDKSLTRKHINKIAGELLPHHTPALYNQAMMEFGAIQCRPKNPLCEECCMKEICFAYEKKMINLLPLKTKKTTAKKRFLNYLVISLDIGKKKHLYINKREGNDIWRDLYDFPCIETNEQVEPERLILSEEWKTLFKKKKYFITDVSGIFKHQLTHQTINARFFEISVKSPLIKPAKNVTLITWNNMRKYAFPRLIEKYMESLLTNEMFHAKSAKNRLN